METDNLHVRGKQPALVLFADIVDSSKYSAILGYTEYAERLLRFQKLFITRGRQYFPEPKDPTQEYCQVQARGDEGTVFLVNPTGGFRDAVFRAIEFLYHLKGLLRFGLTDDSRDDGAPRRMGLGAGIHIGPVAYAITPEDGRSVIKRIEGFSINYAKRVESASRVGRYSRIFISQEAQKLLEDKPVVLSSVNAPMKGIDDNVRVYEVRSGLFNEFRLDLETKEDTLLVDKAEKLAARPSEIEEPWEKTLVVSLLDCLIKNSPVMARRSEYRDAQMKLAWSSTIEEDPILLYLRAKQFGEKEEHTQQLRYLQRLAAEHPDFIHVKKAMIVALWAIAHKKAERTELVFARDLAREFLQNHPHLLNAAEKEEFAKLIKATSSRGRGTGKR